MGTLTREMKTIKKDQLKTWELLKQTIYITKKKFNSFKAKCSLQKKGWVNSRIDMVSNLHSRPQ